MCFSWSPPYGWHPNMRVRGQVWVKHIDDMAWGILALLIFLYYASDKQEVVSGKYSFILRWVLKYKQDWNLIKGLKTRILAPSWTVLKVTSDCLFWYPFGYVWTPIYLKGISLGKWGILWLVFVSDDWIVIDDGVFSLRKGIPCLSKTHFNAYIAYFWISNFPPVVFNKCYPVCEDSCK